MKNAISWFEIPVTHLDKAQAFYEATLACQMRREAMGPSDRTVGAHNRAPPIPPLASSLSSGNTAPCDGPIASRRIWQARVAS